MILFNRACPQQREERGSLEWSRNGSLQSQLELLTTKRYYQIRAKLRIVIPFVDWRLCIFLAWPCTSGSRESLLRTLQLQQKSKTSKWRSLARNRHRRTKPVPVFRLVEVRDQGRSEREESLERHHIHMRALSFPHECAVNPQKRDHASPFSCTNAAPYHCSCGCPPIIES